METKIVFTVKDLIYSGIGIALILLIIYLVMLLKEVMYSIKTVRKLIEDRRVEIDDIIIKTPEIMTNVNKITGVTAKGFEGAATAINKMKKKKGKKVEEEVL